MVTTLICFGTNVLELWSFVVIRLPEEGTLGPKHVRVLYICVQLMSLKLLFYLTHLYMFRAFLAHHQEMIY
jgi:hypothetical protein